MEGRFLFMILVPNREAVAEARKAAEQAKATKAPEAAEQAEATEAPEAADGG